MLSRTIRACHQVARRSFSTVVSFKDVSTSRLKDVSFNIEDGAKVCFMGSNEKGIYIVNINAFKRNGIMDIFSQQKWTL